MCTPPPEKEKAQEKDHGVQCGAETVATTSGLPERQTQQKTMCAEWPVTVHSPDMPMGLPVPQTLQGRVRLPTGSVVGLADCVNGTCVMGPSHPPFWQLLPKSKHYFIIF